jgi:hypothetical protein
MCDWVDELMVVISFDLNQVRSSRDIDVVVVLPGRPMQAATPVAMLAACYAALASKRPQASSTVVW